jgi:hypothetical protein
MIDTLAVLVDYLRSRNAGSRNAYNPSSDVRVHAIFVHPFKSCRPVQLKAADFDRFKLLSDINNTRKVSLFVENNLCSFGFLNDRRYMLVSQKCIDGIHSFVTQRQISKMVCDTHFTF